MKPRSQIKAAETVAAWRTRRTPLRLADDQRRRKRADTGSRPRARAALSFSRILVPIDFSVESTRALKVAAALGPGDEGTLLLVHVVGPIYDFRDYGYGPVRRRRPNEGLMRHAKQRLQALGRRHVGEKREWRCVVRSGTAPGEILKAAEDFRAEVVIMPTRGLSHAPPTEVGSTAERVVRHAPCPVLVLPRRGGGKGRK
jgi:universal stress protein A